MTQPRRQAGSRFATASFLVVIAIAVGWPQWHSGREATFERMSFMSNTLIIDPEKCTSCRLCELVCSQRNAGAYRPSRSRIEVAIHTDAAFYFPMACFQCDDAPCMKECAAGAIVRDPVTKVVKIVLDECTECRICETACPFGVIKCVDGKAQKCEYCEGDPECARFCTPGALRYEPEGQWPAPQRQAYADRLRRLHEEAQS
jgi:anaerobic carbon-monoxide dehydrogenase iron sulfur subunit